jgi:hypothetical protein
MVNPLLTLVFDLAVIGAASAILASMYVEYRMHRPPVAGRLPMHPFRPAAQQPGRLLTVGTPARRVGRTATRRQRRAIAA